jgi:D-galactose 1-dehydrogenase
VACGGAITNGGRIVTPVINIGLVGLGKIAIDQHLPAIAAHDGARLAAVASRNARAEGVAQYADLSSMLSGEPTLDAIILCQPPQVRFDAAVQALEAGKHVFLEKPPGITVDEVKKLIDLARQRGVTLYASWHSRFGSGVSVMRSWLKGQAIRNVSIIWKEDVCYWHPGQDWIWQEGGFGVFDPGINALSILTSLIDAPVSLTDAVIEIAANHKMPIAARLALTTPTGAPVSAEFDFRQTGPQIWDIAIKTDTGNALLSDGGNSLSINGQPQALAKSREYYEMYAHFFELVQSGAVDVDLAPLEIAERALETGRCMGLAPFECL